ncbi:MAG TPA: nucleotidyl transferase AbiEii/AbiGii toxin family protein [Bacteroidales bacterium]|nr:nucleotidyl transferase AbiEii/AbiGii toxin family protein [Bacteroidales bacterium]
MIALNEIVRQYPKELQRPEFYDPMVKEYLHHYMLQSVFSGKFAEKISFLGGTALRYFYGIKRFSEDLDFDCFNFTREQFLEMTSQVEYDLRLSGYDVIITDRMKDQHIKAFRRVFVFPELRYKLGLSQQKESKFFIKIEAEPHNFDYQPDIRTLVGFGIVTPVKTVPLDILFSTKIAAAIKRKKDRDFYDVVTLIDFATPDFMYLDAKCQISNPSQLKASLLNAAKARNLADRKKFDCEHMLFDKKDISKIRTFSEYMGAFDFSRFD